MTRGYYELVDDAVTVPTIEVLDASPDVEFTGILDPDGNKLMRRREPVGFVRFDHA